jgi:hypothetical protein
MVFSRSKTRNSQFVILSPSEYRARGVFRDLRHDNRVGHDLMAAMQRFRGQIYLEDGAIRPEDLTADGRHIAAVDDKSWHVLSIDDSGEIRACLRYLEESKATKFDDLWVRHAAAVHSAKGPSYRHAVEQEMLRARRLGLGFGEVGGWAVAKDHRWTMEPLRIILATYGLLELLGGCAGVATATFRHGSAAILRRIGLTSLISEEGALHPYYDPHYGCEMELLRFDSRFPDRKYQAAVSDFSHSLKSAMVICRQRSLPPASQMQPLFDVMTPVHSAA